MTAPSDYLDKQASGQTSIASGPVQMWTLFLRKSIKKLVAEADVPLLEDVSATKAFGGQGASMKMNVRQMQNVATMGNALIWVARLYLENNVFVILDFSEKAVESATLLNFLRQQSLWTCRDTRREFFLTD
jgi:hypothetical protein